MKPTDLPYSCQCGTVQGSLHDPGPGNGDRYVCYCNDCRDIVRLFRRETDMLDPAGGVSLYMTRLALFSLARGRDRLACIHLTDGPLLRWYATCCDTPLFHTVGSGRFPFITMLDRNCDPYSRDTVLGPPTGHIFTAFATASLEGGVPQPSRWAIWRKLLPRMIKDYIAGAHKRSPLFDPQALAPMAMPRRLTSAEAERLGRSA